MKKNDLKIYVLARFTPIIAHAIKVYKGLEVEEIQQILFCPEQICKYKYLPVILTPNM
jgi:hypothetical protein